MMSSLRMMLSLRGAGFAVLSEAEASNHGSNIKPRLLRSLRSLLRNFQQPVILSGAKNLASYKRDPSSLIWIQIAT